MGKTECDRGVSRHAVWPVEDLAIGTTFDTAPGEAQLLRDRGNGGDGAVVKVANWRAITVLIRPHMGAEWFMLIP